MSRAAFLLLLLLPSSAHADTWIGGAIAGNYQASEQLPTDGNAKSLEVEAGVYRWRDAEARWGYHAGVNVEKYVGMFEGASAMMGTARFGRTLRYDESDQMFGRLAHWKLGQAFAHPYRALAFYGAGRFMTDVLVENVLESPDAPRRDLVGAGGGFSFERRDQNGFHLETRLDLYVFAADGIPKDIEFEGGGGFSYFDLKLQIRFGDATGFTVGVGLGLRGFHLY